MTDHLVCLPQWTSTLPDSNYDGLIMEFQLLKFILQRHSRRIYCQDVTIIDFVSQTVTHVFTALYVPSVNEKIQSNFYGENEFIRKVKIVWLIPSLCNPEILYKLTVKLAASLTPCQTDSNKLNWQERKLLKLQGNPVLQWIRILLLVKRRHPSIPTTRIRVIRNRDWDQRNPIRIRVTTM